MKKLLLIILTLLITSSAAYANEEFLTAARVGDIATIEKLLKNKDLNINVQASDGYTALIHAAAEGHTKIVELLLDNNALVNVQEKLGMTALMFAIGEKKHTIAQILINSNADMNLINKKGTTAILIGVQISNVDGVKLLVENGADLNIRQVHNGRTPLMYITRKGHRGLTELFIKYNADLNIEDFGGVTALDFAVGASLKELLREHGAK